MPFLFYWIPAKDSAEAEQRLNEAVRAHRIVSVEKHFCGPPDAGWAVCLEFLTGESVGVAATRARGVDYREVLDEPTFRLYSRLRELRKELAAAEGAPPYVIVTNEQLASIAERRCSTLADLNDISGFGESRVRKYGAQILACIRDYSPADHGGNGP